MTVARHPASTDRGRSGRDRSRSRCRCVERREHDRGPGRHVEATDLVVLDGILRVGKAPLGTAAGRTSFTTWKRVGEVMQFLQSWCMVSEDGVELFVQPRSDFGVRPEYVPGRRHGSRRSSHGRRRTW